MRGTLHPLPSAELGVWRHARKGRRLLVQMEPFGRLPAWARAQLEAEAARLAKFLDCELSAKWEAHSPPQLGFSQAKRGSGRSRRHGDNVGSAPDPLGFSDDSLMRRVLSISGVSRRLAGSHSDPQPETQRGEHTMQNIQKITPCLWFDEQAEEAAKFYTSIFKNSRIVSMTRYGEAGHEVHGRPAGTVMTVAFELDGHAFTALNGGPLFKFNEAISFQVSCETQEELDYYWDKLSAGGDKQAQQCGWLKDKYGVSWQVFPTVLLEMINDADAEKSQRVMKAMLQMKKMDIETLKRAYDG
jgi:predicted 3-demethylubiquinone-9 3-methyltransferase (glyoxalase superfamily)